MVLHPSLYPGHIERHLLRRNQNPLFEQNALQMTNQDLLLAQRQDQNVLLQFMSEYQSVLESATSLEDEGDIQELHQIRQQLDQMYLRACSVANDQRQTRATIKQMAEMIEQIKSIRLSVEENPASLPTLDTSPYDLLKYPLVADLLIPNSLLIGDLRTPALLSADDDNFHAALSSFMPKQLSEVKNEAERLVGVVSQQVIKKYDLNHRLKTIQLALNESIEWEWVQRFAWRKIS